MDNYFIRLPLLKRIVPSLRRRIRVFFNKRIFWTKINGIFYLIDIQDKLEREFYFNKKYEEDNFNFIFSHSFFTKNFIFLDIGSNLGIYSLKIAKKFDNCHKILAFEPIPETFNKFKLNIKKNLLEKRIETNNVALSNKKTIMKMSSILKNNKIQSAVYKISDKGIIKIHTEVFDNLYNYHNKNLFIKCDVEGHEYEAIFGMKKNLKNNKCLIQVETLERDISKINNLLNKLGYRFLKKIYRDSYYIN